MSLSCRSFLACFCLLASPAFGTDYPVNEDTLAVGPRSDIGSIAPLGKTKGISLGVGT